MSLTLPHRETIAGSDVEICRLDRRLDPYLATVLRGGIIAHTGLFATAQKALSWGRRKAREACQ